VKGKWFVTGRDSSFWDTLGKAWEKKSEDCIQRQSVDLYDTENLPHRLLGTKTHNKVTASRPLISSWRELVDGKKSH
jgi:hypothetical protein